jgi:hypothetical protein
VDDIGSIRLVTLLGGSIPNGAPLKGIIRFAYGWGFGAHPTSTHDPQLTGEFFSSQFIHDLRKDHQVGLAGVRSTVRSRAKSAA